MQRAVWGRLQDDVQIELANSDKKEPDDIEDFGFHYPVGYVERAAALLYMSNYTCWPDSGGWADQDDFLVDDVMRWFHLRRRVMWEVKYRKQKR